MPTYIPDATPASLNDQLHAVAAILAAGLARLRAAPPKLSDSDTNELAVSARKSVTVPDA